MPLTTDAWSSLHSVHRESSVVGDDGCAALSGGGGRGSGRGFSATLHKEYQEQGKVSKRQTDQPKLGYGDAFSMLIGREVDGLRPTEKGTSKQREIEMPSDREGAKQLVTQQLTELKKKVDDANAILSAKVVAEQENVSGVSSSGTGANASKSYDKDEVCDAKPAKEEPFGDNKNIHTLSSIRSDSSRKLKTICGKVTTFS